MPITKYRPQENCVKNVLRILLAPVAYILLGIQSAAVWVYGWQWSTKFLDWYVKN